MLDATAPSKRGKEREVPKAKKPSPLKKVREMFQQEKIYIVHGSKNIKR